MHVSGGDRRFPGSALESQMGGLFESVGWMMVRYCTRHIMVHFCLGKINNTVLNIFPNYVLQVVK